MNERIKSVNVEEIMETIRKNIEERGYTEEILSFNEIDVSTEVEGSRSTDDVEFNEDDLNDFIHNARVFHNIPYYEPFPGNNKVKIMAKRVGRKAMAFQMNPLRERQNQFNYNAVQSIRQLAACNASQNAQIKELTETLMKVEAALCMYEKVVEDLESRIEELESK